MPARPTAHRAIPPKLASLVPTTPSEIAEARCAYVLRAHVVERIGAALGDAAARALLVKGAGLALAGVYPTPWLRRMGDVDLLVAPDEVERVVGVLERADFVRSPPPKGRARTAAALGEVELSLATAGGRTVIEVHGMLDKIVARPIPFEDLWSRATLPRADTDASVIAKGHGRPNANGQADANALRYAEPGASGALRVPNAEDHFLLVVLHAATSEFRHDLGLLDLALLTNAEPALDWAAIERRARAWGLTTALHVALRTLGAVDVETPRGVVERTRPRGWRAWALAQTYAVGSWPVARGEQELGARWVAKQVVWRDDLAGWLAGVARFAGGRAVERVQLAR